MDLTSSLEAKFEPNKSKKFGKSVITRRKSWERITILGAFGVISGIQRAKFGVFVTYIFGGKIWGSDTNFRGKFWGEAPSPRPPDMEVPPRIYCPCTQSQVEIDGNGVVAHESYYMRIVIFACSLMLSVQLVISLT